MQRSKHYYCQVSKHDSMPRLLKVNIPNISIFACRWTIYLTIILSALAFYSCSKNNVDESKVVNKLIADAEAENALNPGCNCQPFINQYRWGFKVIYIKSCKGPFCSCMSLFYDENGKEFKPASNSPNILQDVRLIKNIWTCP